MEVQDSPRWLLVSDVDDTLTGDEGGLAAFSRLSRGVMLVLNSSRPRASILQTVGELPPHLRVDGMITALGTEISLAGAVQPEWTSRFAGWDRRPVDEFMLGTGATLHPEPMQTPFKASFSVPAECWQAARERVLHLAPESRVITSGKSDFDVIPAAAGKDRAALWVAERLGFDLSRLVVAGDSGNDAAMFDAARMAIAVGNARPELLERADPQRTFFANRPRAWGVIEGLRHWGAIP